MRKVGLVGCLFVAAFLSSGRPALPQTPAQGVEVKVVPYAGLGQLVQQYRGKVVVVDFWATYCPPCRQALPHMVQMQKDHAADGLVVISVSLDEVRHQPEKKQSVIQVLKQVNSQMHNIILDEDFALLQTKLRMESIPCAFVFNRDGKWVQFQEEQFRHDLIEQTVVQFLKAK